jgi:hypothetical protein
LIYTSAEGPVLEGFLVKVMLKMCVRLFPKFKKLMEVRVRTLVLSFYIPMVGWEGSPKKLEDQ